MNPYSLLNKYNFKDLGNPDNLGWNTVGGAAGGALLAGGAANLLARLLKLNASTRRWLTAAGAVAGAGGAGYAANRFTDRVLPSRAADAMNVPAARNMPSTVAEILNTKVSTKPAAFVDTAGSMMARAN